MQAALAVLGPTLFIKKNNHQPYNYQTIIELMQIHSEFTHIYFNNNELLHINAAKRAELSNTLNKLSREIKRFNIYFKNTREYYNRQVPSKVMRSLQYSGPRSARVLECKFPWMVH